MKKIFYFIAIIGLLLSANSFWSMVKKNNKTPKNRSILTVHPNEVNGYVSCYLCKYLRDSIDSINLDEEIKIEILNDSICGIIAVKVQDKRFKFSTYCEVAWKVYGQEKELKPIYSPEYFWSLFDFKPNKNYKKPFVVKIKDPKNFRKYIGK